MVRKVVQQLPDSGGKCGSHPTARHCAAENSKFPTSYIPPTPGIRDYSRVPQELSFVPIFIGGKTELVPRMIVSAIMPQLPRACFRQSLGIWRFMSLGRGTTLPIGQGGRLQLQIPKATATMKFTTQWIDSCHIAIHQQRVASAGLDGDNLEVSGGRGLHDDYLESIGLALEVDEALGQANLVHDEERGEQGPYLIEVIIPEIFSLDILLASGSVSVAKKMKGTCRIRLEEGNIEVGIVRGEDIVLSTNRGLVHVDELEGKVDITATTNVSARLINGSKVQIAAAGDDTVVKVGGLYSSGAQISSTGDVTVSASHGLLSVNTKGSQGDVTLSSVNGAVQVSTDQGDARIHVDTLEDGTNNYVRSDTGDVSLSVSQEVRANLEIKGDIGELPLSFEGHAEAHQAVGTIDRENIKTSEEAYGSAYSTTSINDGRGKIDLAGARNQSLRQYFKTSPAKRTPPTLSVSSVGGTIRMETLSWADNVVRKFTQDVDK